MPTYNRKNTNSYSCYFCYMYKNKLYPTDNTACWASVQNFHENAYFHEKKINLGVKIGCNKIYIYNFNHIATMLYKQLLLDVINKITPCRFETIENRQYIVFELLKEYNQSLLLLNFIRNLWYDPLSARDYRKIFFETLKKIHDNFPNADPLEKLTRSNIIACKALAPTEAMYSNHSNACQNLRIKTKNQIIKLESGSLTDFLTFETGDLTIKDQDLNAILN